MPIPLTLTGQIEHGLADLVALGVPLSRAARMLGVSDRTVRSWYRQEQVTNVSDARLAQFRSSIDDARLEYVLMVQRRLSDIRRTWP